LEVKGERETIVRELEQMDEVGSIHIQESDPAEEASSTIKLRVASKKREDIREALFFRMADLRLPILAMKQENLSLEDIFLKLTTDEKVTAAIDSAPIEIPEPEVDEDA
jgi:ABC-2 type transport system ATP-binding protein